MDCNLFDEWAGRGGEPERCGCGGMGGGIPWSLFGMGGVMGEGSFNMRGGRGGGSTISLFGMSGGGLCCCRDDNRFIVTNESGKLSNFGETERGGTTGGVVIETRSPLTPALALTELVIFGGIGGGVTCPSPSSLPTPTTLLSSILIVSVDCEDSKLLPILTVSLSALACFFFSLGPPRLIVATSRRCANAPVDCVLAGGGRNSNFNCLG